MVWYGMVWYCVILDRAKDGITEQSSKVNCINEIFLMDIYFTVLVHKHSLDTI